MKDGTFSDVTEESGVDVDGDVFSPLWGDINNDGYLDLFVGKQSGDLTCQLFLGSNEGVFTEITLESGIVVDDAIGSATFGDFNLDGLIDLFVATRDSEDYLFENTYAGEMTSTYFTDVSTRAGIGGESFALPMQATWVDYDNDFDPDLFALHDGNLQSRFYQNSSFLPLIEVSASSKLQVARSSMGVAWGDYDNDGWKDVYITNIDQGNLFRNTGNGRFEDVTVQSGTGLNGMSWGVVFVDFDNDGDEDLFIGNTFDFDGRRSFLYENVGGEFVNIARDANADLSTNTFGVSTGDFNKDGLMDLVVGDDSGANKLLINQSDGDNNWLYLTLEGDTYNKMAAGATVNLYAGGSLYTRSVYAGSSYRSQISPTLHFGLEKASVIDSLFVHWGKGSTEIYYDLPVNKDLKIVQNSLLRVGVGDSEPVPATSEVSVFPNPSVGLATFIITIPETAHVRIELFDVTGRKVDILQYGVLSAGEHRITHSTSTHPAGVYFYRVIQQTLITTGKLVISK